MTAANAGRRVVVTGQGVVSSIGTGVESFWTSLTRGACGIGPIKNFETKDLYITIASEVRDFDPRERCPSKPMVLADRYSQFAGAAAIRSPFGEKAMSVMKPRV